jgi:hypothetical protein
MSCRQARDGVAFTENRRYAHLAPAPSLRLGRFRGFLSLKEQAGVRLATRDYNRNASWSEWRRQVIEMRQPREIELR